MLVVSRQCVLVPPALLQCRCNRKAHADSRPVMHLVRTWQEARKAVGRRRATCRPPSIPRRRRGWKSTHVTAPTTAACYLPWPEHDTYFLDLLTVLYFSFRLVYYSTSVSTNWTCTRFSIHVTNTRPQDLHRCLDAYISWIFIFRYW